MAQMMFGEGKYVQKDGFDKAKDAAQVLSLIAVPVLLAVFGWKFQADSKDREIRRDYVQIATSILASKDSEKEVREWAAQVLQENSPTPFGSKVTNKLAALPASDWPRLPPLPAELRQTSLKENCSPSCQQEFIRVLNALSERSKSASGDPKQAIEMMGQSISELLDIGGRMALVADLAGIAGLSCERAYDAISGSGPAITP